MQQLGRLRRVTLQVLLQDDGSVRDAAQRLLHAFSDQSLRALGIDLHQVEARPVGAEAVERDRRHPDGLAAVRVGPALQRTRGEITVVQDEVHRDRAASASVSAFGLRPVASR